MAPPAADGRPTWRVGDSARSTALFAALAVLGLHVLMLIAHLLVLDGSPRVVMAAAAVAGTCVGGAAATVLHRRLVPDHLLGSLTSIMATIPLVSSLLHLAVTGELQQTTVVTLAQVGVAAVVPGARTVLALVGGSSLVWCTIAVAEGLGSAEDVQHHGFGLLLSALLAYVVFGIRARTESRLRRAGDELDQQVQHLTSAWETVEQSNHRFHDVFTASPVGIGLADESGAFVEVNEAFCRLLGRTPAELVGSTSRPFTHPDDLDQHTVIGTLVEAAENGVVQVEKRYLRPDGTVVWAWLTVTHVPGPEGQQWTLAHVQDVTERRSSLLELEHSRADLAAIAAVAHCGQDGTDPRPVLVEQVERLAGAVSVALVERDGDDLVATASAGIDVTGTRVSLGSTSLTVHAWHSAERVFVADVRTDPRANPALVELTGTVSTLCEPVLSDGDLSALLVVGWAQPVDEPTSREATVVATLAAEAGTALTAERLRARLERNACTDPLTGLLNRRGWVDDVTPFLTAGRPSAGSFPADGPIAVGPAGRPLAVVMADLDHFKAYNDGLGHAAGDALLAAFGALCRQLLPRDAVVGRWGGEEFVIALPGHDERQARRAVEALAQLVPDRQTASFGIALADGAADVDEVLRRADTALYEAKAGGRNRVRVAPASER